MMHRKANRSVRKAKKKRRTIIGNAVCLLIASVVFTACSNSEYDDKHSKLYNAVYEAVREQNGSADEKNTDERYVLNRIHEYNSAQESGNGTINVKVTSIFVEYQESKENYLGIVYGRGYNDGASGEDLSKSTFYLVIWHPNYLQFLIDNSSSYRYKGDKFYEGNTKEWRTISLENKITQADADMYNVILLMSEYYPILKKELNIDFADYGYKTNFSEILNDIKKLLPEEEINQSQTNEEQTNRDYSDQEQDDLDFETNNNTVENGDNSYNYQDDQPEQPDTNNDMNDFDKEEREYEKKQKELSKKNYKDATAVLNKIESAVNKGDLRSYDEIYALYERTIKNAEFTDGTYNMKPEIENVLSSYREYCSESGNDDISIENRDFYKQMIHRQIKEFKDQWKNLSA